MLPARRSSDELRDSDILCSCLIMTNLKLKYSMRWSRPWFWSSRNSRTHLDINIVVCGPITRQRPVKKQHRNSVFYMVRAQCYKQNKFRVAGSEQVRWWLVSELDNRWDSDIVSCCCKKLVAEDRASLREPRGRGTSATESCYQATAGEDCNRLRRPSVSYNDLWCV